MADEIVDVLIIGAGASGAAAAWSLADTGMHIMCMEQGGWTRQSEYATNFRNWEVRRGKQLQSSPNIRGLKTDYPINDKESPISIVNFNGVGGSTVLFSAHFP
ncbi:MAG TPA: NAD(P)-binding protein, partial [Pseudomonadales bacterium]|nr:NAD(P)-binding protein [Pseudomonadales bacterium]